MPRKRRPWGYESRGIPFSIGCLPFLFFLAALIAILYFVPDLFERCVGRNLELSGRRGLGLIISAVELICSPLLLFGPAKEIALFLSLIAAIGANIFAFFWERKHKAYWDVIRASERERRAQRKALKSKNAEG